MALSSWATSAWVGFWPRERRSSPSDSRGTWPVPRLSKSAKASLYSAVSLRPQTCMVWECVRRLEPGAE